MPKRLENSQFNKNCYTKKEFDSLEKYVKNEISYEDRYKKLRITKYFLTLKNISFYKGIILIILYPFMKILNVKIRIVKR